MTYILLLINKMGNTYSETKEQIAPVTPAVIDTYEEMLTKNESDDSAAAQNLNALNQFIAAIPQDYHNMDGQVELEYFWSLSMTQRDYYLDHYGFPNNYVFGSYDDQRKKIVRSIDGIIYTLDQKYGLGHIITRNLREKLILYSYDHGKEVLRTHMMKHVNGKY